MGGGHLGGGIIECGMSQIWAQGNPGHILKTLPAGKLRMKKPVP